MTQTHEELVGMLNDAAAEMGSDLADRLMVMNRAERRREWKHSQHCLEGAIEHTAGQMGLSEADGVRAMQKAADGFAARLKSISTSGGHA